LECQVALQALQSSHHSFRKKPDFNKPNKPILYCWI
jgi:hypothetical protein